MARMAAVRRPPPAALGDFLFICRRLAYLLTTCLPNYLPIFLPDLSTRLLSTVGLALLCFDLLTLFSGP